MSERTLNDLFAEADGGPITWRGQDVFPAWEREIRAPCTVWIDFLHSDSQAGPQSITIAVRRSGWRGRGVTYGDEVGRSFRFWSNDPSRRVAGPVGCRPPRNSPASLLIYNGWLDDRETHEPEEWFGNHAILIEPDGDGFLLRCSRGGPPTRQPDFGSLTVRLVVTEDLAASVPGER